MDMSCTLVTGATGAQGGAVARRLMSAGHRVRVLCRDPDAGAARALADRGAEIRRGDYDDVASVAAALAGVQSVFSVQVPGAREREHGDGLVAAARQAGVRQFVHSSVCGTAVHTEFPRWGSGYWYEEYWSAKWHVEQNIRAAGFEQFTILRPAFLMDNFIPPKVDRMFPELNRGVIATVLQPQTVLQLISVDDIAAYTEAALADPARFHGQSIDLAAEAPTLSDIADTLAQILARPITLVPLTPQQALDRGQSVGWVRSQEWTNEAGYHASIAELVRFGVPLTSFAAWLSNRRDQFPDRIATAGLT